MSPRPEPPILVVGAGIAGLSAALDAGDSPAEHAEDTLLAGHCNDREAVRTLVATTRRFAPAAETEAMASLRQRMSAVLGPLRRRGDLLRALPSLAAETRQHAIARILVMSTLAQRENLGAHQWDATDAPTSTPLRLWPDSPSAPRDRPQGSARSARP